MGYRELTQVLRVELPLAVPLLMAGVRTSAVQVVATATLAALISGGGFGRYIIDGLAQQDFVKLFAGALLVGLLAVATELSLAGVEWLLVPRGIRLLRAPAMQKAATFKTA
jgi:osmoprotectant transport system permease protein